MIHHVVSGDAGPWLVFVHGMTCDHTDWDNQIDYFSADHRCLSVDLPAHGQSAESHPTTDLDKMAAAVLDVMAHHGIDDAVAVGHSMGTRVVMSLAAAAPTRVGGVVLVDGGRMEGGDAAADALWTRLEAAGGASAFVDMAFQAMFTEKSDPARRGDIVRRALATPDQFSVGAIEAMLRWDSNRMDEALANISCQVAVVQSTGYAGAMAGRRGLQAGEITPFMKLVASATNTVVLDAVADTGHFVQLDAPDRVNSAISVILASR